MSDPTHPKPGELAVDANELTPYITDLAPGERQGMRTDQPGLPDVLDEIDVNQPTIGVEIGIGDKLISNLNDIGARISRINDFLPAALKLVELLEETKAKLENDRYNIISSIATLVDKTRICGSVDLYAAYEKTRAYRSAIGKKAAATRKKNAEAQASDQGAAAA